MIKTLKPFNLLLFDSYILALLYLFITWNKINCGLHCNIWQLFYYLVLFARLVFDELENNSKITKKIYWILTFISSGVVLLGMGIYELVAIFSNPEDFNDPDMKSSCFENRILLVGQCIIGFLIIGKDVGVFLYERSHEKGRNPL